jgi:hypothetical protein
MTDVEQLSAEQATVAANFVVQEWIRAAGLEALALWQAIEKARKDQGPIETWVADPKSNDPEVAELCRHILKVFLNTPTAKGLDFRRWAQQGIDKATQARGHVLDPVSLLIGGTLLIGLVLAARVKRIGDVEFYEGIPENVADLVKATSSMATFG